MKKFLSVIIVLTLMLTVFSKVSYAEPTIYNVTNQNTIADKGTNHGYLELSSNTIEEGGNITITAHPNEGYRIYFLGCYSMEGNPQSNVTDNHNGTYTLTCTNTDIKVSASFTELITSMDLNVEDVNLETLNGQELNLVSVNEPTLGSSSFEISQRINLFDNEDNLIYAYGELAPSTYVWADMVAKEVVEKPQWSKVSYALADIEIEKDPSCTDDYKQLASVTLNNGEGILSLIDKNDNVEGYYLNSNKDCLTINLSLELPLKKYEANGVPYYEEDFKVALAAAQASESKTLYILNDVTIDAEDTPGSGTFVIDKSVTIKPKDDDVTITLKSHLRLKTEETPIEVTFGGDDDNLTILADMDQRWFATRNGILTFGANTFCDGRNHIYNVDGPFAVCQKVDGTQGQLIISGASIKNFRTTGNGGAILSTGGSVVLQEDEIGFSGLIKDCYAAGNGGAIYNEANGYITVSDGGHILNCSALNGGGIYSVGTVLVAGRAQLSECTARKTDEYQTGKGGAIYMYPESGVLWITQDGDDIYNPIITNCSADKGGAIYLGANVEFLNTADPLLLEYNTSNVAGAYGNYKSIYVHEGYTEEPNLGSITEYLKSSSTKKYKATNTESTGEKISGTGKKGSKRTITPIEGKKVSDVIVKDKNGNKVDVTLNEDGTYTFIQPASDVTVEVNYKNREITLNIGSTEADVDGEKSNLDVAPLVRNDRTMLPIRFVAENLGAKVEWNEKNPEYVLITKGDIKIEITLGSDKAKVNGKEFTLDSVAFAENDRTYLPVRFVSEHLNAIVEWNEAKPMEVKIYER